MLRLKNFSLFLALLFSNNQLANAHNDEEVVKINHGIIDINGEDKICVEYFQPIRSMPKTKEEAKSLPMDSIVDLRNVDIHEQVDGIPDVKNKMPILGINSKNSSFHEDVKTILDNGAVGFFFEGILREKVNASQAKDVFAYGIYLQEGEAEHLLDMQNSQPDSKYIIYGPVKEKTYSIPAFLIILLLCLFTVIVGSYLSGNLRNNYRLEALNRERYAASDPPGGVAETHLLSCMHPPGMLPFILFTNGHVALLLIFLILSTLLLYLFYNNIGPIFKCMFIFLSTVSVFGCLEPLVIVSYDYFPKPVINLIELPRQTSPYKWGFELRRLLLALFSIFISLVWLFTTQESYSWILQNGLQMMIIIHVLKAFRLPNFKVCCFLLLFIFFFESFFTFCSILLVKNGTLDLTKLKFPENLPILLSVPIESNLALAPCWTYRWLLLGNGELMFPGLVMSYCHAFDLLMDRPVKMYWLASIICYAISLIMAFVGLIVLEVPQLGLAYCVPMMLIPLPLLALIKGEFKQFWSCTEKEPHRSLDEPKENISEEQAA